MIVATFPPDERGRAVGAWTAWGGIGTVLGPLVGGQLVDAASWRWIFAINVPIVLVTLVLDPARRAGRARARPGRARRRGRRRCCARSGSPGSTFGLIEQPLHGWGDRGGGGAARRRRAAVRRLRRVGGADARTRCCRSACSGGATSRSATSRRSRCTAGSGCCSSSSSCSCSRWRATPRSRPGSRRSRSRSSCSLLSDALRRAGRPPRAALLHGRRAARRGRGAGAAALARRRRRRLTSPTCCPGCWSSALGLSMTVAPLTATVLADADEQQRRHRVGRQQRDRARGRPARDRGGRGGGRLRVRLAPRRRARRPAALKRPEVAKAVAEAKKQPLATRDSCRACRRRAASSGESAEDASVHGVPHGPSASPPASWRSGGVLGLIGIANPRRRVEAADCPGGQFVGSPVEACRESVAAA